MRTRVLAVLAILAAGCVDRIAAPNTDVGLTVWTSVMPAVLSVRDTMRPIHVRVYVGNRSSQEIRVVSGGPPYTFTPDPAGSRGLWGGFRIGNAESPLNAGPNTDWFGDSVYVLPPGHVEFDERVLTLAEWRRGGWALRPGRYRVRGWFNAREGRESTLTLTP